MRVTPGQMAQSDQFEHAPHPCLPLGARDRGGAQTEAHVVGHAQVRKERVILEHDAHPAVLGFDPDAGGGEGLAVQAHQPGIGANEAGDRAQGGRLAAA